MTKPRAIIVDLDGVLCDHSHRIKYALSKDWTTYHSLLSDDPPHQEMIELVTFVHMSHDSNVILSTGRPERYRISTTEWLSRNNVLWHDLHMRADNDHRPGWKVKKDILDGLRKTYDIWFAIDDQSAIKEMYKREGVLCLQPHEHVFEEISLESGSKGLTSVKDILAQAAKTFEERQIQYKDTYKLHGKVLKQIFPEGITLKTEEDFLKYHLFVLQMIKVIRYARSGMTHVDSQHDLGIYAFMTEEILGLEGGVK